MDMAMRLVGRAAWAETGGPLVAAVPGPGRGWWGDAHYPAVAAQLGRGAIWAGFCEDLAPEFADAGLYLEQLTQQGPGRLGRD